MTTIDGTPNITPAGEDQASPKREHQTSQGEIDLSDDSGTLFSMYLDRVVEKDNYMVESWKGDADGMLTFVGL